jgi:hypothetical protein
MVRSRFALLIRGAAAGAIVVLPAMLTGCVVDAVDEVEGEEDVAESASELDRQVTVGNAGLEAHTGDPQLDPDPVPWRPEVRGNDDPDPDPNTVAQIASTPGSDSSNDKK